MSDMTAASKLIFFKTEKYDFGAANTFDAANRPRPHFCIGLVLEGSAVYHDCTENRDIAVGVGDLIFVPIGSRYISYWTGAPRISYVSIHFVFDHAAIFTKEKNFKLQKVTPKDPTHTKELFLHALSHYDGDDTDRLAVLGNFYTFLAQLFLQLERGAVGQLETRVYRAVSYIKKHYNEEMDVNMLARQANISTSRFYPLFRQSLGMSPIEYINRTRIDRAIVMLMNSEHYSIEEISEATGFQSAAYFRRVFKKITGASPREYRNTVMEI